MVRLVLFIFAIILSPLVIKGQVSVTVDPLSFVLTGNPNQTDIHYYVHVTNTGNESVNIFWSKRMTNQPNPWTSWICDKSLCWDPSVNSCPVNKPNPLAPGESMDLQVHMNPYQTEGTGDYELVVNVDGTPFVTVNGNFIISNTTSVKETNDSRLTVYPNPTSDFFEVSDTPGVKYIEVFNIIGNKVKSFDAAPGRQYYVGDLADGIYLVRLSSASKKVLKTVRLSKR
jgi:hypothetical protein